VPLGACTSALKRGAFPVVQLDPREARFGYRLESCAPAIGQFYKVAYRSRVATLYVPKDSSPERDASATLLANATDLAP